MSSERTPQRAFFGLCALLFVVSTVVTIHWCRSMTAMGGMAMPGGWTLSMAWMRMPGQTWRGAAASFLGMWVVMMTAMMLPALAPMLLRYRQAVCEPCAGRLGWLTTIVSASYFLVWAVLGVTAFVLGVGIAELEMRQPPLARAAPTAIGVVVLIGGLLQFTAWKARQLTCCRAAPGRGCRLPANTRTAWKYGLKLGLRCSYCCAGPTAVLLVAGVMELRVMALVTAAITIERLAPAGQRLARVVGAVLVVTGLLLIVRTAGH